MKIYLTWADKRHLTFRCHMFPNGAKCKHFKDEKEAQTKVDMYLGGYKKAGFEVKQVAERDWEMSKNEH